MYAYAVGYLQLHDLLGDKGKINEEVTKLKQA